MKKRTKELLGELRVMDDFNIKPNYSELERIYGVNRHTIKKYHEAGGMPEHKKSNRLSKWQKYDQEINDLVDINGVTKMSVYKALQYKYGDKLPGSYNGFKAYLNRKGIVCKKINTKAHLFYETEPGEQIQCDWKENMEIHFVNGTSIKFNVFSATLGYSREHIFIYSVNKTEDDFIRCVIEVFRRLGGKTEKLKTDNMSAIVNVKNGKRSIHPRIQSFFKDIGVTLELCAVRTPETKGKDESANRFINWIKPYDYRVKDEEELIYIIETYITRESNNHINQRTQIAPAKLFKKEKKYLKPIGNEMNLETYVQGKKRLKVPNTLLIRYEGNQYSVPSKYIGKYVDVYKVGSEIYIYQNSALLTVHTISQKSINYKNEHYIEGLRKRLKDTDDIEELAKKNLERLESLGRYNND